MARVLTAEFWLSVLHFRNFLLSLGWIVTIPYKISLQFPVICVISNVQYSAPCRAKYSGCVCMKWIAKCVEDI